MRKGVLLVRARRSATEGSPARWRSSETIPRVNPHNAKAGSPSSLKYRHGKKSVCTRRRLARRWALGGRRNVDTFNVSLRL